MNETMPCWDAWRQIARVCKDPERLLRMKSPDSMGLLAAEAGLEAIVQHLSTLSRDQISRALRLQDQFARPHLKDQPLVAPERYCRRGSLESYLRQPEFLLSISSLGALDYFLIWARDPSNKEILEKETEEKIIDAIYDFCTEQPRNPIEEAFLDYNKFKQEHIQKALRCVKEGGTYRFIPESTDKDHLWLYGSNEKEKPSGPRVRIYINVKPDSRIDIFEYAHEQLKLWQVPHTIKILATPKLENLSRIDTIVIYTEPGFHRRLRPALNGIFREGKHAFRSETPRFAMPWRLGPNFEATPGVSVAAQPNWELAIPEVIPKEKEKENSFNGLMARILTIMVLFARDHGYHVSDPNFRAEKFFMDSCLKCGLNPRIPAINANDSIEDYYQLVTGQQLASN